MCVDEKQFSAIIAGLWDESHSRIRVFAGAHLIDLIQWRGMIAPNSREYLRVPTIFDKNPNRFVQTPIISFVGISRTFLSLPVTSRKSIKNSLKSRLIRDLNVFVGRPARFVNTPKQTNSKRASACSKRCVGALSPDTQTKERTGNGM